jgi:hypothetical protein
MNKIILLVCASLFISAAVSECFTFMTKHTHRALNVAVVGGNFQSAVVLAAMRFAAIAQSAVR